MKKKRIDNVLVLLVFMLIMVALGISDSNRGVFSSIFERELRLTKPQFLVDCDGQLCRESALYAVRRENS